MKIVVAIDFFKGSANSQSLNSAVRQGILSIFPTAETEIKTFEIADGGEGTLSALQAGLDGQLISVETVDLLERPITSKYLLVNDLAFIEATEVVGIDKIVASNETIQRATSFGLAKLFWMLRTKG